MGLPRSTFYDAPVMPVDDGAIVARITAICDEFEAYGYRRVGAELRHQGVVVNSKKLRRLMREHDLQPRRRRRYTITTDSNHDHPIVPDLAKDKVVNGPNQLWVADLTYIAIAALCLFGSHSGCLVAQGDWLRHQPLHRCQVDDGSAEGRHQQPPPTTRLRAPLRPRVAVCG
jgi:hypothetical protein